MRTDDLFAFMKERHSIHVKRHKGLPKPWTKDFILQNYKFCNVYRELDRQTIWFDENWRNDEDVDLWFAALVFRFINLGETCNELKYPVPFSPRNFLSVLQRRKDAGERIYSGAYMISTHGVKEEKHLYLAKSLQKIWKEREAIRFTKGDTLDDFHKRLMSCFDVGSFLAAQVIADAKYAGIMKDAKDWWTFAASGPGSRRGLNRVMELPTNNLWSERLWRDTLKKLHAEIDTKIFEARMPTLHAQDLQNCLCEFDKYERARLREGRPKSRYKGTKE